MAERNLLKIQNIRGVTVIKPLREGPLGDHEITLLRETLQDVLEDNERDLVAVDLGRVTSLPLMIAQELLMVHKKTMERGGGLVLARVCDSVRQTFKDTKTRLRIVFSEGVNEGLKRLRTKK